MNSRGQSDLNRIYAGLAPVSPQALRELTVGIPFLTDFWTKHYLQEYLPAGGSKIKFVTGRSGSGVTHFLNVTALCAEEEGYQVVRFSAGEVWLHDFREIYLEILRQCDLERLLADCAGQVIRDLGEDPGVIPEGQTVLDYLAAQNKADAMTRRAILDALRRMYLNNPRMDHNFALCCSLITGGILGYPILEAADREVLLQWMNGEKSIKLSQIKELGLMPSRVTKFNARHMLRSLIEVICLSGRKGLVVLIDDLEAMLSASGLNVLHYTNMRRSDAYESIRQLIDEIDTLHHVMFVYGMERIMMDDERAGIKSYQALWMRIQNEILTDQFNRFTDIVDLDRLGRQIYDQETVRLMSEKICAFTEQSALGCHVLSEEEAQKLLEREKFGADGIPRLVNRVTYGFVDLRQEEEAGL